MSTPLQVVRATSLHGSVQVPGDKSASHRALMLSALASGESTIVGLSPGRDVASTSAIMILLGAQRVDDDESVKILGPDAGLTTSASALNCGNSGTTMRLLCGVVSGIAGAHTLTGDTSLSTRPMDRVAVPLNLMGARVSGDGTSMTAPLHIEGSSTLHAIDYDVPVVSAQVKSAILFAGLVASSPTSVRERVLTRSTTEDMFRHAGLTVHSVDEDEGRVVTVNPGRPRAATWIIPGDPSQAAFFTVLGLIHDCAVLDVLNVDASPQRIGFVEVLQRMGATLTFTDSNGAVSLHAQSCELTGTDISSSEIPSVDEVPILAVAAAAASGVSAFRDMAELRLKESNRFLGSMKLARSLGCRVWDEGDDFFVEGLGSASAFQTFDIDAGLDHRMVMASAVAGCAGHGCTIDGVDTVSSSYPGFFADLASLS